MNEIKIVRELIGIARAVNAGYQVHPNSRRRPLAEEDVDEVVGSINSELDTAFRAIHSSKAEISKAADRVEGSRVNLNFVQIGVQHPGSSVDSSRMRRIAHANKYLKEAQSQLEDVYNAISHVEDQIARASGEIK
jgi:methyl-accepting chemotaxis protein